MDELAIKKILYNLREFNEELNVPRDKINTMNTYNEEFINKVILNDTKLQDNEFEYYDKLKSILDIIEQKRKSSNVLLEKEKSKNELIFDEKLVVNKELYDNEIRVITRSMDKNASVFENNITSITNASYYKNLDIIQTTKEYDKYLINIKNNYLEIINFFFSLQKEQINEITSEEIQSGKQLLEIYEKIEIIFEEEMATIEEENKNKVVEIQKNKLKKEQVLLSKKIELNKKLDVITNDFKEKLSNVIIPFKQHLEYLNNSIVLLTDKVKSKEIAILEEFKTNLEDVDKQTELFKKDILEEQELLKENNGFNLPKKLIELDNKLTIYNETMRTKKIELDTLKSFNVKKLYLDFETQKKVINKKIELTNYKIKTMELINSTEEYLQLSEIRHLTDIDELTVKQELDNIKQSNYLLDDEDKANRDYYNTVHKYQIKLYSDSVSYNKSFYETKKNNVITLNTLEIEKNLILKNYNINCNNLLRKKLDKSSSIIKSTEEFDLKNNRNSNELNKKILSQDIQLANKKNNLQKSLISLEKKFFEKNIINDFRVKLESQTYKIFEDRFTIEKKLYELYNKDISQSIELFSSYVDRYNDITKCSNTNISTTTFDYLLTHLKNALNKSIEKIIKVTTDRINFEGTVNFQYELNKLISDKDQLNSAFDSSNTKMNQTINNYKSTIELYEQKINLLENEIYTNENLLILKNKEYLKHDNKNTIPDKLINEIELVKSSISLYKKEQKNYQESINKNKKSISELEKSLLRNSKKYHKNSAFITNQIDTIDKRHKQESSIYYKFIDKVNILSKSINSNIDKDAASDNVYKYYKSFINAIFDSINEFKFNHLDKLINNLYTRHDVLLASSILRSNERILEIKEMYDLEIEAACDSYNVDVLEIEKKIEKLQLSYENNLKEDTINFNDKIESLGVQINNIDINITQCKVKLLYDIETFNENINLYKTMNTSNISKILENRKGLEKEYYKQTEIFTQERQIKRNSIDIIYKNSIDNLKQSYKNLTKEKVFLYNKKDLAYQNQLLEYKNNLTSKITELDSFISTSKIEQNLANLNLNKAFENSLLLIRKKAKNKIKKEKKKFNKQIKD